MSMQTSMFASFVNKYFAGIVGKITELFNGRKKESEYLHETMLDEEYSSDLTWGSTSMNHSIVAADVVSMDSSLPLKKRGTIRTASGDIAKIGIKYKLNEKTISDVTVMASKGQKEKDIATKILNNVPRVIKGVKTRIEIMFQQALSTGMVLVTGETNDGTGVRASFGYDESKSLMTTGTDWATPATAKPISDIREMFGTADANGDEIKEVFLSELYFNYARRADEAKEFVASANNQVITDAANLPPAGRQKMLDALREEFNATFHVVNNSYRIENEDGSQETVKPWAQGNVVGVPSMKVGRLVHGTLAEDMNRVAGVNYAKSGYILVSEYSHNEPSFEELTAGQALAMPVIDDGGSVYVLHADNKKDVMTMSTAPAAAPVATVAKTTTKTTTKTAAV